MQLVTLSVHRPKSENRPIPDSAICQSSTVAEQMQDEKE